MVFLFSADLKRSGTKLLVCLLAAVRICINEIITSLHYILDVNFSGQGLGLFLLTFCSLSRVAPKGLFR